MSSCFSLVSLYGSFLRCSLTASGLSSQFVDVDVDTTVHFWGPTPSSSQSKNGVSKKSSIVLIHGFGPPGVWQWRQQVSFLAPYFNVYVPDLVFFGESTTKSSERSEIFQAEVIGKLMEKVGVDKYSVIGTSYGGFVTYRLAEMWPERVEKVVVASSGINMRPIDNVEIMKRADVETIDELMLPETAGQLRKLLRFAANLSRVYVPDCILNDFIEKLYRKNRKEKLELLEGLTLGKNDNPNISPLHQEVLIIWGDQDNIFPVDMAKELKEMLGKKAALEVMKKASHLLQIQQARNFNKIIYSFFCASS
ncbi:alpha/beta-Hydrolases superfamily protein [Artemisia annua]|uniref:Alpha/beta-Hydrolases superfamily protein n=1 Tax=Artemisia annua TaxID=35608 RepID=A0A2U1Q3R6_ARTAN|nr:alpha/beta-Hydrolases superfamily protein [Artemisia annua]